MATWKKILLDVAGSVSSSNITDLAVTTAKLETSTGTTTGVTSAKIATAAVTNEKLATDSVTGVKIYEGSVTFDKLQTISEGTLKSLIGYASTPTTAIPEELVSRIAVAAPLSLTGSTGNGTLSVVPASATVAGSMSSANFTRVSQLQTTSDVTFASLTVADLTVNGTTNTISSTVIEVADKVIKLANHTSPTASTGSNSGILVETSTSSDDSMHPRIVWNTAQTLGATGWAINDSRYTPAGDPPGSFVPAAQWSIVASQYIASGSLPVTPILGAMYIIGANVYIGTD